MIRCIVKWFLMVFLILITAMPEIGGETLEVFHLEVPLARWRVFDRGFWYQALAGAGDHSTRAHFVRIVSLSDGTEPHELFVNACTQRIFLARLIRRLDEAKPAVVVLDKFFKPDSCPAQDEGTRLLKEAIAESKTPIVVAQSTSLERRVEKSTLGSLEALFTDDNELIRDPKLQLPERVNYGVIQINHDNRKLPLDWPVYESRKDLDQGKEPVLEATMALAAARIYDSALNSDPRLLQLRTARRHPFASFLPTSGTGAFNDTSAMKVLCGRLGAPWRNCVAPSRIDALDDLRSRIVIVGNLRDARDMHSSVVGPISGVSLQANYIESLLRENYLLPVPRSTSVVVNITMFVFIGILFAVATRTGAPAQRMSVNGAAIVSLIIVTVLWLTSYIVAIRFGYYFSIWFPGAYVLLLWTHSLIHKLHEPQQAKGQTL
jgi:CHASE2 domain-containing sensor protein